MLVAAAAARHAAAAASAAAAEQHDLVAADLGGVALVAVLVVPLARLEAAFDVDLLALRQVFRSATRPTLPQNTTRCHSVFSCRWPRLVVPHFGGRHVERRHGGAARRIAQLGIASEVARPE